ncbi:alpha/beta hydrolase family protein [Roseivivax lentus]|uniref:hypothetical protein n=1 Tax=Roseivivax lentus TaxID=633194 RepID=UPI00117AA30B|nr:hypothetical protein [Roseivivax lentus]
MAGARLHPQREGQHLAWQALVAAVFWDDLIRDDLSARLTEFGLPVYFFVARHDQTANPDLSRGYFDAIEAPVKGFYLFENSAHSPVFEEPDVATRILLEDVLNGRTDLATVAAAPGAQEG